MPTTYQRKPPKPGRAAMRRCLGPAKKEHSFLSRGPENRVCQACRELMAGRRLSPTFEELVYTGDFR